MTRERKLIIPARINAALFVVSFCSGAEVNLSWNDNSDNEAGFIMEASADGGEFVEIGRTEENVSNFTHVIADEDRNVEFVYRVKAFNFFAESGYSNTVKAKGKYFEALEDAPEGLEFNVPSLTINAENVVIQESG